MIRFKSFIAVAGLAVAFAACNQTTNQKNTASAKDSAQAKLQDTIAVLKNDTTGQVYKHYNHLKDALVLSDPAEAKKAGKELAEALAQIKGCESASETAKKIGNSANITDQRLNFIPLSSDIIALLKHSEVVSGKIYVQYCPMANDGKGAYWLASASEIRNPYYGDEMLSCGEVKEEIKKK